MARAVRRHVVAQRVEILAAALREAFHRALQSGHDLDKFTRGFHRGVDQGFRAQIDAVRFLQEAEGEASDYAEGILTINSASWKADGDRLVRAAALGQVGKIDRLFKKRGGRRIFGRHALDAQGKGRQGQLFVFEFDGGADWLAGEDVFWQLQAHRDAGKRERRKNSGHENDGDEAGENQEKQIVAGVERGQRDQNDSGHVEPAFARNFVLHFVAQPAQRGAARKNRDERDGDPAGYQ